MGKQIFSGKESEPFWDAVEKAEIVDSTHVPSVLYEFGCKAQELEAEMDRLEAVIEALTSQELVERIMVMIWDEGAYEDAPGVNVVKWNTTDQDLYEQIFKTEIAKAVQKRSE